MMIVAYIREGTTDDAAKIEHQVEQQTESNGIVSPAYVSDSHSIPPDVVMHCPKATIREKTFFDEAVECFSLRKNLQILTNVEKPANAVPIVDGLK